MKKDSSLGEFGNPNANLYDAIVEGTAGWKATLAHYVELFGGANRIQDSSKKGERNDAEFCF